MSLISRIFRSPRTSACQRWFIYRYLRVSGYSPARALRWLR